MLKPLEFAPLTTVAPVTVQAKEGFGPISDVSHVRIMELPTALLTWHWPSPVTRISRSEKTSTSAVSDCVLPSGGSSLVIEIPAKVPRYATILTWCTPDLL